MVSSMSNVALLFLFCSIFACALFLLVAATIYLINRCNAHSIRKEFLKQAVPSKDHPDDMLKPHSGQYVGFFKQGEKSYEIRTELIFTLEQHKSVDGGRVDYYKVTGTGKDKRGNFRLSKGGCTVGDTAYISYYKQYTFLEKGESSRGFNKLLNTGTIRTSLPDIISGNWQFVNMEPTDKNPHTEGKFRLERIRERTGSRVNTEEQAEIEVDIQDDDETPLISQPTKKTPVFFNYEPL